MHNRRRSMPISNDFNQVTNFNQNSVMRLPVSRVMLENKRVLKPKKISRIRWQNFRPQFQSFLGMAIAIYLIPMTICIWQIYNTSQLYLEYSSSMSMFTSIPEFIKLPTFTVCVDASNFYAP